MNEHQTIPRYYGSIEHICSCGWRGRNPGSHIAAKLRVQEYRRRRAQTKQRKS